MPKTRIECFFWVCKGLIQRGFLCVDATKTQVDNNKTPTFITDDSLCVRPEQSITFRHFLTQSTIEILLNNNKLKLNYLHSGIEQNIGEGTRALNLLLSLCDKFNLDVVLDAYSTEKKIATSRRLFKFYQRFGFKFDNEHEDWGDVADEQALTDEDYLYGPAMIRVAKNKLALVISN